eukprot:7485296-Alexandrium_andersonii.AAC.2
MKEDGFRDVYAEPPADLARFLGISRGQLLKLEGAVYGLRHAPRARRRRVRKDLLQMGLSVHPLGQCVFVIHDPKTHELVGTVFVYVDDFAISGAGPRF